MKKITGTLMCTLLTAALLFPQPALAAEETADAETTEIVLQMEPEVVTVSGSEDSSPDELFADYVDHVLYGTDSQPSTSKKLKAAARNKLSGLDLIVYNLLRERVEKVAAGEESSTEFTLSLEELGLEGQTWTAADLGVSEIVTDGAINQDAANALWKEAAYIDYSTINHTLLADLPYALYWYDKTQNMSFTSFRIGAKKVNSEWVLYPTSGVQFKFPVAEAYALSGSDYTVDTSIGQSVATARENASGVVSTYASASDYEKLKGYKDTICDMVSYNHDAVSSNAAYGDPWQLIWVFDDDASTNVVCEGYAKAFKYLCDLTAFSDDISCILATGTMNGGTGAGGHMWNLVNMENSENYLVDVTNCDAATIGWPDKLFLIGNDSGDPDSGYTFALGSGMTFTYDSDTLALYETADLTLAAQDYDPESAHVHSWSDWTVTTQATCIATGEKTRTCSCGAIQTEAIPIDSTHHTGNTEIIGAVSATTESEGYTGDIYCSDCGELLEEGSTIPRLTSGSITGLYFEDNNDLTLQTGAAAQLEVKWEPENVTAVITWTSDHSEIASVDENGLVTALAEGTAVITAASGEYTVQKTVHVGALHELTGGNVTISGTAIYTGQPFNEENFTQYFTVNYNGDPLEYGTDYVLKTFSSNTNAGTAYVTIEGTGNYTGTASSLPFTIQAKKITPAISLSPDAYTYDGGEKTPAVTVKDDETALSEGTDYTITYPDGRKNVGNYTVTVNLTGNYTGSGTASFKINAAFISGASVSGISDKTYTGAAQTQNLTIKVGSATLKNGTDYTVAYSNNTNVGTATVTITGKGNYAGSISKTFKINAASISGASVSGISDKTYTGAAQTQNLTVKVGSVTLKNGTDYIVGYSNNTNVGTATVTITGKGNYTGPISRTFKINGISIASASISGIVNKAYTGAAHTQNPVVRLGNTTLTAGTDYTVSYKNNTNVGTATVTFTGKGRYAGSVSRTFQIAVLNVKLSTTAYIYKGKARTPGVTVTFGSLKLTANTHYTVKYSKGRTNIGTYKVAVTLKGGYEGSRTVTFTVNPRGTSLSSVKAASKGFTVKWKKMATKMGSARITGYQIQYSTNKNFTSDRKTVRVKGYKSTSKKISKLKGKTKYYVRIRTYMTVKGTTYYSGWSKVKTVTTKK